jgi:hypothetical protein
MAKHTEATITCNKCGVAKVVNLDKQTDDSSNAFNSWDSPVSNWFSGLLSLEKNYRGASRVIGDIQNMRLDICDVCIKEVIDEFNK